MQIGSVMFKTKDSLRGSPVKIGTVQRILAWPLRKDDAHKPRSVNNNVEDAEAATVAAGGLEHIQTTNNRYREYRATLKQ